MRIELPIISFLCLPLVLLPLPWHWRARNVATLTMIISFTLVNLIHGINSIVWAGSVVVKFPVWCDIVTKLLIGTQISFPAASFCIAKHLEAVSSVRHSNTTRDDKRRRTIFELCLCVGLPCLIMALHYIVQGHRFDILEDLGCQATTYHSWPAFVILYVPPIVLTVLTLGYATAGFCWFLQRRSQFAEHLQSCNSGLTTGRYFRLMAFSVTVVIYYITLAGYVIGVTIQDTPWRVWDNWANVHSNFSRVAQLPRVLVPEYFWTRILVTWYMNPIGSVTFFVFFGFGREARIEYSRMILWFRTQVLRQDVKPTNESVLPTFSVPRTASAGRVERHVQLDDMDMMSIDEKWNDEHDDFDSRSLTPSSHSSRPVSTPHALHPSPQESGGPSQTLSASPKDSSS